MVLPTLFLSQWSNGRLEEAAVVVLVRRVVQGDVRTTTTVA
jgi:hypothetical protein